MKRMIISAGLIVLSISICAFVFAEDEDDMLNAAGIVLKGPAKLPQHAITTNTVPQKASSVTSDPAVPPDTNPRDPGPHKVPGHPELEYWFQGTPLPSVGPSENKGVQVVPEMRNEKNTFQNNH